MDCASDGVICTKAMARHTKMSFSFTVCSYTGSMSQASATAEPPEEPPALSARVEGISGCAPHGIARIGARAKFRHVGLAENDCACLAHERDHGRVMRRHMVTIERRAVGGQQPGGLMQILDAGRQAVQRPELLALASG